MRVLRRDGVVRCLLAFGVTWLLSSSASAQSPSTYNIEELTAFHTGLTACVQHDLNTVTASLRQALDADAWTGPRYLNQDVFEQDFWDTNRVSDGLDRFYADSARLSVYAGHGSPGTVYFPGNGGQGCFASTTTQIRLGAQPDSAGGQAALAVWLACQVLNVDLLGGETSVANVRQQLGWLNNVSIGDDEPRDVYEASKAQGNTDAWLALMGGPGGENPITHALEDRRPIVVTMTDVDSVDDCWAHHESQAWGNGVLDLMPGDARYVCWEQLD